MQDGRLKSQEGQHGVYKGGEILWMRMTQSTARHTLCFFKTCSRQFELAEYTSTSPVQPHKAAWKNNGKNGTACIPQVSLQGRASPTDKGQDGVCLSSKGLGMPSRSDKNNPICKAGIAAGKTRGPRLDESSDDQARHDGRASWQMSMPDLIRN